MDPITVSQLVHDRTLDLKRTADGLRQERALRPPLAAESGASPAATGPAEFRRSTAKAGGCSPAEPAV